MAARRRAASARIRLGEDTGCGDQHRRPCIDRALGVVDLDAAVDLERHVEREPVDLGTSDRQPVIHLRLQRLVGPPRSDAHEHHVVDRAQVREDRLDRRLEVECQTDAQARRSRFLDRGRRLGNRFQMEADDVETGIVQLIEEALGRIDHEMPVQRSGRDRSETLHDHGPQRDRRHEVAVHDVDVEHLDMWLHGRHLRPQSSEVCGQDGSGNGPHDGRYRTGRAPAYLASDDLRRADKRGHEHGVAAVAMRPQPMASGRAVGASGLDRFQFGPSA